MTHCICLYQPFNTLSRLSWNYTYIFACLGLNFLYLIINYHFKNVKNYGLLYFFLCQNKIWYVWFQLGQIYQPFNLTLCSLLKPRILVLQWTWWTFYVHKGILVLQRTRWTFYVHKGILVLQQTRWTFYVHKGPSIFFQL